MCGFRSITTLPHRIFLYPSKKLLCAILISSHVEEKKHDICYRVKRKRSFL